MIPVIVKLGRANKPEIFEHLNRLDANDRYYRFFAAVSDFALAEYVNRLDFSTTFCIGAFHDGKLVAFLQLSHIASERPSAELAVSIDVEHRGSGLAASLFQHAIDHCTAHGIGLLYMSCLRENKKMQALARKQGLKVIIEPDEAIAELNLTDNAIERLLAMNKEYRLDQITVIDRAFRFNSMFIDALLGVRK